MTLTSVPQIVFICVSHLVVTGLELGSDVKAFIPRMVFPLALFPEPDSPRSTRVSCGLFCWSPAQRNISVITSLLTLFGSEADILGSVESCVRVVCVCTCWSFRLAASLRERETF